MGEIADAMVEAYMRGARDDEEAYELAVAALALDDEDDALVNFLLCDEAEEENAGVIGEAEDEADAWMQAILLDRVVFDGPTLRLKPGVTIEPFVPAEA